MKGSSYQSIAKIMNAAWQRQPFFSCLVEKRLSQLCSSPTMASHTCHSLAGAAMHVDSKYVTVYEPSPPNNKCYILYSILGTCTYIGFLIPNTKKIIVLIFRWCDFISLILDSSSYVKGYHIFFKLWFDRLYAHKAKIEFTPRMNNFRF